ncbi:MAG: hypothetical protein RR075_06490, partial [Pygmaiobacter sp.]
DGFAVLLRGETDTLGSLELAEHLAFCDLCCEKYANLLSDDCLLAPPAPLAPSVLTRLHQKARLIFFNRYLKVGLAASLAMALWFTGTGTGIIQLSGTPAPTAAPVGKPSSVQRIMARQEKESAAMQASLNALTAKPDEPNETLNMKISSAVDSLLKSITPKGENTK